ncbi:MAG: hypothetical protein AAFW75_27160 [Cyanobacteria bacterium J06636_16]
MTNYLKPGRYRLTENMGSDDVMICADKSQFGYTGANPLCGFKIEHPHTPMLWCVDHIQNPEAGPLPERPTVYIVTHDEDGERPWVPVVTVHPDLGQKWRQSGATVRERPWPEEWSDLLEGE